MDDSAIIDLFNMRSEQAITELSNKYGKVCNRIACNILHNKEDAEECVNDAYFVAWNNIPPHNPKPLITYICKIVRNCSLKKYRYNRAQKRNSLFDVVLDEVAECIPSDDNYVHVEDDELTRHLQAFLSMQSRENRVIFIKRYWYAESIKTIAETIGMTENAVSVKIFRTRQKLKEYLEREGVTL